MKKMLLLFALICIVQISNAQNLKVTSKSNVADTLAFDGIPFGVTKNDIINKYHKAWFDDDYKIMIGNDFYLLNPKFTFDGKLLSVDVLLEYNIPDDLTMLIASISSLRKMVRLKYGLPFIINKMPTSTSIRELIPEVTNPVEIWRIGDKYISVGVKMVLNGDNTRSYYSICTFMSNALMIYEMRHVIEQVKESESKVKSLSDSLNKVSSSMF